MGLPYCKDCPDHEPCYSGIPCTVVKSANGISMNTNETPERGTAIMSGSNTTKVTKDEQGEKLHTVPAQSTGSDSESGEKTPVVSKVKNLVLGNKQALLGAAAALASVALVNVAKTQRLKAQLEGAEIEAAVEEAPATEKKTAKKSSAA